MPYLDENGNPIAGSAAPSQSLQGAVAYGSQQDPVRYAKLLRLEKLTGIPATVANGNEPEVQQLADTNALNAPAVAAAAPRTTGWASSPDNAAVSGVDGIHNLGQIEQHAATMRAYTPTLGDRISDKALDLGQWMMGGNISREQLRLNFWTNPLIRSALDIGSGVAGMAGNLGSFFGWHGDGPTKENLLQRIDSSLDPTTATLAAGNKSTGLDWLMKNVAPMVPAVLATGGTGALARTLGVSDKAAKVMAGLTVGGMFTADQSGRTYTQVAGAGGSDDDARLAANRVALINALPNAMFGATDVVPWMRDNPLLTSLGLGGATGASGQVAQNWVTGKPLTQGLLSSMVQGAAMQGGMHLGTEAFFGNLAHATEAAQDSPLRERSPEKFHEAAQTIFDGDSSLRIPADKFSEYFQSKQMDPRATAASLGVTNYAEALLSGGDVEVPPANYLAGLEPEHQNGLFPHIVDPNTGLTLTQHQEGVEELRQWMANGGDPQEDVPEPTGAPVEGTLRAARTKADRIYSVQASMHPEYTGRQLWDEVNPFLTENEKALLQKRQTLGTIDSNHARLLDEASSLGEMDAITDKWRKGRLTGPERMLADAAEADAETAATPEWQAVKEDLRQRYVDAGETPEVADTLATSHANVIANLARESGRTPAELLAMYSPKVTTGEAPRVEQPLYQDAIENIRSVVEGAKDEAGASAQKATIAPVHPWIVEAAKNNGLDIEGYTHVIDGSAVRHVINRHGNEAIETSRGQLPVSEADFDRIPEILDAPDQVVLGTKTKGNKDQIGYMKRLEDGTTLYLEEARTGKKELATVSMRKYPATKDFDGIAATLPSNARSDGGNIPIVVRPPEPSNDVLFQEPLDRAGRQFDSPAMAEARSKAEAAEAAGDAEGAAEWTEKFHELREADPRFQAVLKAREAYAQAKDAAVAKPGDEDLARAVNETFRNWKTEAAKVRRYGAPEGQGGPRGWFRVLPDGSFEIGKTSIGDLSTFVHEPAHAYLRMLDDLATREGASESLKDDYAKVREYLGAGDGEELTREQQEKWARANEQYLREGKAPSEGLRGVFQRFAVWLGSIYKKATDLGVELTPEIRDVFDRMYASEEGVNRAAQDVGPKLFTSPEEAGWTEEEFKRYAEENNVSVEEAKEHIFGKLGEVAERDQSQSWREEVGNVRQAVAEQIDARPEYKTIRGLRKGQLEDGTPLTLNKDSLTAQFGEERVRKLQELHPGLYRADGGADAEAAAEMHGFASAEDMVRALEGVPRRNAAIDQATREYMTAKHGDIRFDGTLNDKALLALEAQRGNRIYRELQALKAKAAKTAATRAAVRAIEVAPIEAYREAARQMVEKKAVADLQPTRYLDASRKYSREAFDAVRKGDAQAAADAKHKELMNHFLFREATEARKYVEKFEAYAKRALGKTVQGKLGQAGSDYQAQFNRLLYRYGLSGVAVAPERPLAAWADELYERGKEPAIDPAMYNEARAVHYRQASVAEVRTLRDALENIRTLAYQELQMEVHGRTVDFADAVAKMTAKARETLPARPARVLKGNATLGEKVTDFAQRGDAMLMRTERLMEWLDGGKTGPWHDNLWNLAADSQGREYGLQEEVTKALGDALERMPKEQRAKMLDKVTVPGIGEPVTRHDLISMAFNLGNDGNVDRLQKTFLWHGWDAAAINEIPKLLTREEWQFVQDGWDSLKPLGAAQAELERRLTGLAPVMVTPVPQHVELADGSSIDLEGGYFPIVMDPRFSARGAQQDASTTAQNVMESGYGRAATSRGNMQARTGFGGPVQLDYEQVLTQHTAKVIKDITHREFMLAANKLLLEPAVRQTLRETLGEGYEEKMMPWLRTIVNDRNGSAVQGLGDFSRMMRTLRSNLTLATLSYKISTSLLQWTHAPRMLLSTNPGSYAQAMVDFLAHPVEMTEQIKDLSPNEMAARGDNLDRDIRETLRSNPGIRRSVARAGNVSIKYTDHMLSFPLWLSVYRDALKKHADLPEDRAQYLASHEADSAVRLGLGSGAPKDLPPIMRNNDLTKLLTMFYSFHNGIYGQLRDIGHQYRRSGGVGKLTYGLALSVLTPAVLGAIVTGNGPKDDENKGAWAAKRALLFGGETVPLVRDVANAMDRNGDVKFTPLMDVLSKGTKATQQAFGDDEEKDWTAIGLNYLEVAGDLGGVPGTTQAMKPLRYMHRAQKGEIENPNAWDAMAGSSAPRR